MIRKVVNKVMSRSWQSWLTASIFFCIIVYITSYFRHSELFLGQLQTDLIKVRVFQKPWELALYRPILFLESVLHNTRHGEFSGQVRSGASLPPPLESEHIHFILPNDYRGIIKVIIDETDGINIEPENNYRTYHVPANGTILVKSLEPFETDSSITMVYDNGEPVRFVDESGAQTTAMEEPFFAEDGIVWFFVGADSM